MKPLHEKEKAFLREQIELACKGTPLQENAEFAGTYLVAMLTPYLENWGKVREDLGLPDLEKRDKVVINRCYGGFGVSREAFVRYHELAGIPCPGHKYEPGDEIYFWLEALRRDDPYLVRVVEELGERANGSCAKLEVVEIYEGSSWSIRDHDGKEELDER